MIKRMLERTFQQLVVPEDPAVDLLLNFDDLLFRHSSPPHSPCARSTYNLIGHIDVTAMVALNCVIIDVLTANKAGEGFDLAAAPTDTNAHLSIFIFDL